MRVKTRYFGEVDIEDTKVIHFEKGIRGLNSIRIIRSYMI